MPLLRSTPLRSKSDKARARDARLSKVKFKLLKRAQGKCEISCGESLDGQRIDHHHVFGRSWLGEEWADSVEAGAVGCRDCHDHCTNNPTCQAQQFLEAQAYTRLHDRLIAEGGTLPDCRNMTVRRAALVVVTELERMGVQP